MNNKWMTIGTVVGNTTTYEFTFILKKFKSKVGDIIAVKMSIPTENYNSTQKVFVWGRITNIDRYNPFFPFEAAQELGENGINIVDTILSNSRDQLQANVLVLGYSTEDDAKYNLYPLTYPIEPASDVLSPSTEAITKLLQGDENNDGLFIGNLISRSDVKLSLKANPVVARHMAILAMTGGGKTVASRRVIRELANIGYPLLIIDPHGDYLSLAEQGGAFPNSKIKLFYPHIKINERNEYVLKTLISKMTRGLTEAQQEVLDIALEKITIKEEINILNYIHLLYEKIHASTAGLDNRLKRSVGALTRSLRFVEGIINNMEHSNQTLRSRLKSFDFYELPDPVSSPNEIIAPSQISILYLGGYDHLTQSTIVSILLDSLFNHRISMSNQIPPFFTVIEEAHNFIPSVSEGQVDTPSIDSVRKIITEGRKFGTGLLIISQRPSRLDQTILSQCNTFLILRLVNPKDQSFVRQVMENLSESDARMLPGFGPGQGLISGQAVRFPLLVKINMDVDLIPSTIGDENFIKQINSWSESSKATEVKKTSERSNLLDKFKKSGKSRMKKSKDD